MLYNFFKYCSIKYKGEEKFTVKKNWVDLLYFLPGVKLDNFTRWIYCFLFSFPPLTNSVQVAFAVKVSPPSPYSTTDSCVSLTVFHVTIISFSVSASNKRTNNCLITLKRDRQVNVQYWNAFKYRHQPNLMRMERWNPNWSTQFPHAFHEILHITDFEVHLQLI